MLVPLALAVIAAPVQLVIGDWSAKNVAENQPVKLAAMEGLYKTTDGAPETIGGWYNERTNEIEYGVQIPKMLSLLAFHDPNARVQGLETVPAEDRPPVNVVRIAFQTMVGIGTFMVLLSLWFLFSWFRKKEIPRSKWFYRGVVLAGPGALIATIAGWVVTEVGRQPWVVYEILRTESAVTGADGILFGFAALAIVYSVLIAATIWVLVKLSKKPLSPGIEGEALTESKEARVAG